MTNKNYVLTGISVLVIIATFSFLQSSLAFALSADNDEVMITDEVKHIIPLDKIRSGVPKDSISSLDRSV